MPIGPFGSTGRIAAICTNELMPIGLIGSTGPIGTIRTMNANWANWIHGRYVQINCCQLDQLVPSAQLARYVVLMPIQSAQLARYVIFMPIGPIGSTGPIGAIFPTVANWANWFHGPNWCDMYYVCQLGQLVPRAQLVRYVSMNDCQLGQLVPSAQLARYVLFMPIAPIGSSGPIGAICPNELMPIGPIGSIGPIGAIYPIVANWANWFHGPNWCDMYQ